MMLITAVVAPSRVGTVKRALGLFGVRGLSESRAFVEVRPGARVEVYRSTRWVVSMAPRVRLEVLSPNADTPDLVHVIARAVTGSDLQLWVTRVDHLVRIRTGEVGLEAL
jgi:nitrogen regulatory protein PII